MPTLVCLKMTGPADVSFVRIIARTIRGSVQARIRAARMQSAVALPARYPSGTGTSDGRDSPGVTAPPPWWHSLMIVMDQLLGRLAQIQPGATSVEGGSNGNGAVTSRRPRPPRACARGR